MSNARKKVIVRSARDTVRAGYLALNGIVERRGDRFEIDLLDLEGRIVAIPLDGIRWIAYVRDFNLADHTDPERLTRRIFLARPRSEGLWMRLTLTGGDLLEGLAPLDLALVDGLLDDRGFFLIPPDIRSNTQRLYVPRTALVSAQLLAVITTPSKSKPAGSSQESLFPVPPGPPSRT